MSTLIEVILIDCCMMNSSKSKCKSQSRYLYCTTVDRVEAELLYFYAIKHAHINAYQTFAMPKQITSASGAEMVMGWTAFGFKFGELVAIGRVLVKAQYRLRSVSSRNKVTCI